MENYEKYPIFVKKKKSKTCLILKRQKELQMDGNFDTSDINNLKRKKISRKDLANLSKGAKKKKKKHYKIPLVFVNKSDNIRTPTTTRVASIRLPLRTEGGGRFHPRGNATSFEKRILVTPRPICACVLKSCHARPAFPGKFAY